MTAAAPFVVGVAGWKNAGKTTLVTRLVAELTNRGYRVATIKHSHHPIDIERDGTDSARHREAGALGVAVLSPAGWGIVGPTREITRDPDPAPPLAAVVARLAPADIVIVEGWKSAAIPKIEVRRDGQGPGAPLAADDEKVFAIATDCAVRDDTTTPVYASDDVKGLTDTLLRQGDLAMRKDAAP